MMEEIKKNALNDETLNGATGGGERTCDPNGLDLNKEKLIIPTYDGRNPDDTPVMPPLTKPVVPVK